MFVDTTGELHSVWPIIIGFVIGFVAVCLTLFALVRLVKAKTRDVKIQSVFLLALAVLLAQTVVVWPEAEVLGGLINLLVSLLTFIGYYVVGTLVAFVVSAVQAKAAKTPRPNYRRQVIYTALVLTFLGAWVGNGQEASQASRQAKSPNLSSQDQGYSSTKATPQLSAKEQARLVAIEHGVMQDPAYMTPQVRAEFWSLIDKSKASPRDVQSMKESLSLAGLYVRSFWQDALSSYRAGHSIKSDHRQKYESRLGEVFSPGAAQQRISKDDAMIAKIASHKPVDLQGTSVVMNGPMIQSISVRADASLTSLDKLFTRP